MRLYAIVQNADNEELDYYSFSVCARLMPEESVRY